MLSELMITKPVTSRMGIFVAIAKQYIVWVKIIILFYAKNH